MPSYYTIMKVLIIDDETDLCLLLKGYFMRKGFEVFVSYTLESGLMQLADVSPDILFLDNNLPDGLGWLQASSLAKKMPELQFYFISAYHPPVPDMPSGTVYHVIEKPVSSADLDIHFTDMARN